MKLEKLRKEKPTNEWRERMNEGEDIFTDDIIFACEESLDMFIDSLIDLGEEASQDEILDCVEEVVLTFNDLNEEFDYFIETMEREELWEFIDKAARAAGLKVKKGEDITGEWRDW